MSRIAWMLVGGLTVLALQTTGAADDYSLAQSFVWRGDCSKGATEVRLDCLTWQVEQLKRRLDGRDGRVLPLGQ
jgi:hypothetical protein